MGSGKYTTCTRGKYTTCTAGKLHTPLRKGVYLEVPMTGLAPSFLFTIGGPAHHPERLPWGEGTQSVPST